MSSTAYDSRKNIMKRASVSGSIDVAAPSTNAYVLLYITNYPPIPHNLGYVPAFRYAYEPFKDGVIWPPLADRNGGQASNPTNTLQKGPGIIAWADETNLYIQLFYTSNALTGTYKVHYTIYRDFKLP